MIRSQGRCNYLKNYSFYNEAPNKGVDDENIILFKNVLATSNLFIANRESTSSISIDKTWKEFLGSREFASSISAEWNEKIDLLASKTWSNP